MAKPTPWKPPLRLAMALAMPMTWPRVFTTGPPELPGLMAASVWMKSSKRPPITRLLPLMTPTVTVWSRPKGLPMAITASPTFASAERPNGTVGSPVISTLTRARSVSGSEPSTLPDTLRPSLSVTSRVFAPSTT